MSYLKEAKLRLGLLAFVLALVIIILRVNYHPIQAKLEVIEGEKIETPNVNAVFTPVDHNIVGFIRADMHQDKWINSDSLFLWDRKELIPKREELKRKYPAFFNQFKGYTAIKELYPYILVFNRDEKEKDTYKIHWFNQENEKSHSIEIPFKFENISDSYVLPFQTQIALKENEFILSHWTNQDVDARFSNTKQEINTFAIRNIEDNPEIEQISTYELKPGEYVFDFNFFTRIESYQPIIYQASEDEFKLTQYFDYNSKEWQKFNPSLNTRRSQLIQNDDEKIRFIHQKDNKLFIEGYDFKTGQALEPKELPLDPKYTLSITEIAPLEKREDGKVIIYLNQSKHDSHLIQVNPEDGSIDAVTRVNIEDFYKDLLTFNLRPQVNF